MDDYQFLGITPTTDIESVKKAFRKRALELHPDKNKSPDATNQFIRLKNTFERIMQSKNIPPIQWVTFESVQSTGNTYTVIITYV